MKEVIDRVNRGEKVYIPTERVPIFQMAIEALSLKFSCDIIVNGDTACIVAVDKRKTMTTKQKTFKLTRWQSVLIVLKSLDPHDSSWLDLVAEYGDEETGAYPSIYEVLAPLGITKYEIDHMKEEPKP